MWLDYYLQTGQHELARTQLGWLPPHELEAAERIQVAWRSAGLRRTLREQQRKLWWLSTT